MKKKSLDISSFYIRAPKIMTRSCTVPEICCAMDRQMDGRMEKVTYIEVGAPPKKIIIKKSFIKQIQTKSTSSKF